MENAQKKSVPSVPATFRIGGIDILRAGVQVCALSSRRELNLLLVTGCCVCMVLAMLALDKH